MNVTEEEARQLLQNRKKPRTKPKPPEVEPARSGSLPTPSGGLSAGACTGLTARWCPVHGDCACVPEGATDHEQSNMNEPGCPLHGRDSDHAEPPEPLAEFTLPGCCTPRTKPKPPEVEPARSGSLPTPSGGRSGDATVSRFEGSCTCQSCGENFDLQSDGRCPHCGDADPERLGKWGEAPRVSPLAEFTLPGCCSKKNNPQITWPSIAKLGLRLAPKRPVRGLKDWLVLVRSTASRGNLKGVIALLSQGLKFYPAIQPSAKYQTFAKDARRYLDTRVDIRRPLVPPGETLVVDALFYLPTGRAGARDEPGLLESLFDVIEDNGIIGNDYWLKIGPNCDRIWPPKGQSKAAKAARADWVPRMEVRIYRGEPRRHGA